jgi:hypothetical protein
MKAGRMLAALVACLCASLAHAGEPRVGKFVKYDAGDYVIITSRSAPQAKRFMEDLVKFRATLERLLGKRATPNSFPTTIVITSSADWNKWLQPRQNVGGFFHRGRFSNYMAMNGEVSTFDAGHVMFHEYTHYYLASQFAGEYPPWFNEGMAELMGYVLFDQGMAILRIPMAQVYTARTNGWIPFERLIRVDQSDPEYQSHELAPSFYAQSWLTVQYGLIEKPEFGQQIFAYLRQLNVLVPQEQAIQKAFGTDLAPIDKQLRDYLRESERHSGGIKLGDVPGFELPAAQPLSEFDAMSILADVMLESRFAPVRTRPLTDSLLRRDPNGARAAILAARLAQLGDDNAGFDKAIATAEGALAPGDWEMRRELATVLLMSALDTGPMSSRKDQDTEADLKRAMKWSAEAIAHNDKDVEALWGFGTAATRLDTQLERAEQALVSAYKLEPSSADIAQSLAALKLHQQQPEAALPFLRDVIRNASQLGLRRWAAETYLDTQKYVDERNAEEADNQRRRAEYERQVAEYEKKYGKKKR